VRRIIPMASDFHGQHFFTVENGRRLATPLFLVLILVEFTDLIFAVDSIPAVFAVTRDPFLVYSSNAFAVLGLRTLYFLLGGIINKFRHLKYGLSAVLILVGTKMLLADVVTIPTGVSLGTIAAVLLISVCTSVLIPSKSMDGIAEAVDSASEDSDRPLTGTKA